MEDTAASLVDASPDEVLDVNCKTAKQTRKDAVMQDKTLQQEEETKTGKDDVGEVDEENEVMEMENTKKKRRRRRKHRHSSKEDAADQAEVVDVNAASSVNDDSQCSADQPASKQKVSTRQGQPKKDRPRSAEDKELTQSQYLQLTGQQDWRQGGAAGGEHEDRPMSSKGQSNKAGKSHKAEQKGRQTPSKTPKGKPQPETHEASPKRDRPNSSKGRMYRNQAPSDQQKISQTPKNEKSKGATSRNTPRDTKSSKNQKDSPQTNRRAEAQMQQNVQNGEDHTPSKGDPMGQRTPGSEGRGKKPKTPKSKNRNGAGTPNRKNFKPFEDYLSFEEVSHGLKRKHLLQGTLRINPRNYEESYIDSKDGGADIMISGVRARNRALEGDVVAVELLDKSAWKLLEADYMSNKKKKLRDARSAATASKPETAAKASSIAEAEKALAGELQGLEINDTSGNLPSDNAIDLNAAGTTKAKLSNNDNSMFRVSAENRVPAALPEKDGDSANVIVIRNSGLPVPDEESPQEEIEDVVKRLFPDNGNEDQTNEAGSDEKGAEKAEEEIPRRFFQKQGKIVYIIEKRHSRASSGLLKPPTSSNATDALFSPTDHRMPRMYIPLNECPDGFLERPGDFETTLFIARLEEWPKTSVIARGHLHRSLGEAGEIEPETEGMLIEHGVDYSDFSDEVIECLPKNLPWTIPQEEIAKRRDFRDHCVFTIDPASARDLDDALSCVPLGDGLYEMGVHIADVSFFVDEGNALDSVAGLRATSVYLVQKVIPMLPRLLCEHLCSLNPNEDKLTFSFLWKLTEEGEILEEWCGRSVIRSCVKMSYDHAQGIIAEPEREWRQEEMPPITGGFTISDIAKGVLNLNKIAQNLRKKRSEDGALRLDQIKLQYGLDKESGLPCGYSVYQQRDSNKLVEEFMLLANMAAAHRVHDYKKKTALLRRHPPPKSKMMDDLAGMCADLGLKVDGSSSKSIQESLSRYLGPRDDKQAWGMGQILTVLYSKPMQRAKYFCAGTLEDEVLYRHYALNVPLYTHFTSPIRRYADILVHRQLAASLGVGPVSERDTLAIQEQAMRCNERKEAAKKVSDMSSEMFFAIFVRECGPLEEDAMVMQVLDRAIDVLVMNLGVVKRVYCNALPLKSFKFEKQGKQGRLTIVWEADEHHPDEPTQILQLFSLVKVELKADKEPLKFTATMKRPDVE
ncbi:DIS3-like exonuclease 2 [Patiria miniata]|uniref:DIS3-like exonuclease 2 n=1 Tax=Patiria miniata TaxID=46514 RepID=A0A914BGV6_PATMI|nr:DIS3-like exonuclease 2 [Patiria miniata]